MILSMAPRTPKANHRLDVKKPVANNGMKYQHQQVMAGFLNRQQYLNKHLTKEVDGSFKFPFHPF